MKEAELPKRRKKDVRTAWMDNLKVEWIPVYESPEEHEERVKKIRQSIVWMYLNMRKRGRPSKESGQLDEES